VLKFEKVFSLSVYCIMCVLCMCFECILKVSYIQVNSKMMWIILHYHIYQVNICRLLATFWYVIQISYDKVNSILFQYAAWQCVFWGNKNCVWCFSMFVLTPTLDLCCVWFVCLMLVLVFGDRDYLYRLGTTEWNLAWKLRRGFNLQNIGFSFK
jgi:hypothetical protein